MIVRKDEEIFMQTVTPPVPSCSLEKAPAEPAASPQYPPPLLQGVGRTGDALEMWWAPKNTHKQAKFWSNL